jgi:hypothetical protein
VDFFFKSPSCLKRLKELGASVPLLFLPKGANAAGFGVTHKPLVFQGISGTLRSVVTELRTRRVGRAYAEFTDHEVTKQMESGWERPGSLQCRAIAATPLETILMLMVGDLYVREYRLFVPRIVSQL